MRSPANASPRHHWSSTHSSGPEQIATPYSVVDFHHLLHAGFCRRFQGVPFYQLMAKLLYGSGLRLMECIRLRVHDIDFDMNEITVRNGKGFKDRITLFPEPVQTPLHEHLERVKILHEKDLADGFGRVYLPYALARKYKNADKEWGWQGLEMNNVCGVIQD